MLKTFQQQLKQLATHAAHMQTVAAAAAAAAASSSSTSSANIPKLAQPPTIAVTTPSLRIDSSHDDDHSFVAATAERLPLSHAGISASSSASSSGAVSANNSRRSSAAGGLGTMRFSRPTTPVPVEVHRSADSRRTSGNVDVCVNYALFYVVFMLIDFRTTFVWIMEFRV